MRGDKHVVVNATGFVLNVFVKWHHLTWRDHLLLTDSVEKVGHGFCGRKVRA